MPTFGECIERTYRRLLSNQREQIVTPTADVLSTDTNITFQGPGADGIQPGSIIALDEEKLLVTAATANNNNYNWTVIRGFQDSTAADYTTADIGIVDPKFDRFDVGVAINDALNYLSSPTYGLFRPITNVITYSPVIRGYDLGAFPNNFTDVLEVTCDQPDPFHNFPTIRSTGFKIRRGIDNPKIPSGVVLILDDTSNAFPGLTINVTVAGPFTPLINLTDDLVTLGGFPATAIDIPSMCAEIDLTITREIKRNFIEEQPDPRRAADVPAGSVTAEVAALMSWRDRRVAVEADRLRKLWPRY